jgi:hypothetical protein
MMVKAALLFLVAMLVLGLFGRWKLPRGPRNKAGTAIEPARKCPDCGAYVVGSRPGPCARADCPMRA